MKQKYVIDKNVENNTLIFREYAELDKESLSLLCEQSFPEDVVKAAIAIGKNEIIRVLRTQNLYPPMAYMDRIADEILTAYQQGSTATLEVMFDDMDLLVRERELPVETVAIEEEAEDIETLLDDDDEEDALDDEFGDDDIDINSGSPLKIADEDALDIDDET